MTPGETALIVRVPGQSDRQAWQPLWDGDDAFYGRDGSTALERSVSDSTWARILDPSTRAHGLLAEIDGHVVGLVHYRFIPAQF